MNSRSIILLCVLVAFIFAIPLVLQGQFSKFVGAAEDKSHNRYSSSHLPHPKTQKTLSYKAKKSSKKILKKSPARTKVNAIKTSARHKRKHVSNFPDAFPNEYGYQVGIGTFYGPGFVGKRTASGEIMDPSRLTAAHMTLPMFTMVRVVNLKTGQSVDVTINDRGPFKSGRVIDLSVAAAKAIDLNHKSLVKISVIKTSGKSQKTAPTTPAVIRISPDKNLQRGKFIFP